MANSGKSLEKSLKEYGRGLTGGLLFSLPMLYTMELWWIGFIADPVPLAVYFLVGLGLLIIYNHFVGLRKDHSFIEEVLEAIEEMGLGLMLTLFILWLTQRIAPGMSLEEIGGKVIVESVTMAIGISVGKSQLGNEQSNDAGEDGEEKPGAHDSHLWRTVGIALCGTILVASNVAPTEEIVVIALEAGYLKILMIALLSFALGSAVLYYINFKGAHEWVLQPNSYWDVLAGGFIMYAVALASSAFMLWFFGRFEGLDLYGMVAEIVVLGFPATLGASAGRLLIQS